MVQKYKSFFNRGVFFCKADKTGHARVEYFLFYAQERKNNSTLFIPIASS